VRLGLLGRAQDAVELLVALHLGGADAPGAPWGDPVAFALAASLEGTWHRAAVPPRPPLPRGAPGVWLVATATRGVFHWYTHQAATAQLSVGPDGAPHDAPQPWAQLHVETPEAEPAPLELWGPSGRLSADLLAPAAPVVDPTSFRREGLAPLAGAALAALATLGDTLPLGFFCARDVSMRVLDARLGYDPATGAGSA
jgi:hypothetical protein